MKHNGHIKANQFIVVIKFINELTTMIITVLSTVALNLLKILAVYLLYEKFLKQVYLRVLYGQRGVTFMSKVPIPFAGDTLELVKRINEEPDRPHITQLLHDKYGEQTPPCIGMYWPHGLMLLIQDPDYLKDLFQTYNEVFTKQDHAKQLFSRLWWNSLIWTQSSDPSYKPRRKMIAHAFYANNLRAMSETIFSVIH